MGFRLLLLLTMGLGAMYMMHLLAQDFNRIRQPVSTAARALVSASVLRDKRQTVDVITSPMSYNTTTNATTVVDWKRILSRDPFGCLQSLICQLMSGAKGSRTREAIGLMNFLQTTLNVAPAQIVRAYYRGWTLQGNSKQCFNTYPFCFYSARTMLKILNWFTVTTVIQAHNAH